MDMKTIFPIMILLFIFCCGCFNNNSEEESERIHAGAYFKNNTSDEYIINILSQYNVTFKRIIPSTITVDGENIDVKCAYFIINNIREKDYIISDLKSNENVITTGLLDAPDG